MGLQSVFRIFLLCHGISNAIPVDSPASIHSHNPSLRSSLDHEVHSSSLRRDLRIVKTTKHSDGTILDWVIVESQVSNGIAAAPPLPAAIPSFNQTTAKPTAMLQEGGQDMGPEGTVPIPRVESGSSSRKRLIKSPPIDPEHPSNPSTAAVGDHWYASSAQTVNNFGGRAIYNLWNAYTQASGDFSLLQVAVIRYNVPKPGNNAALIMQTVEAGWINYPGQIAPPHLFTYFTTNGYSSNANNEGGWNRDVGGWVQVDTQIFPGTAFSPLSTPGGTQYEMQIQYLLYQGNWWLYVLDRWIGYYPGTLFGAGTDPNQSLQTASNAINFYGEIYDSHPQLTTTDMGSGRFPEGGFAQAAYIRNIAYTNTLSIDQPYDGSRGIVVSDTNRYRLNTQFQNQDSWGSYMYLGGPGAGGVIGG